VDRRVAGTRVIIGDTTQQCKRGDYADRLVVPRRFWVGTRRPCETSTLGILF
jgi:hypothetical protein